MTKKINLVLFILLSFSFVIRAEERSFTVDEYLVLGPVELNMPVGSSDQNVKSMLTDQQIDVTNWWPAENDEVVFYSKNKSKWEIQNQEILQFQSTKKPTIYYVGFYVSVDRFTKADFEGSTCQLASLYLDDKKVTDKTEFTENCDSGKINSELKLENGKHFLLLKLLFDPSKDQEWSFKSSLLSEYDLSITTDPIHFTTVSDLLENKKATTISLSPDGEYAAISFKERNKTKNEFDHWIEIHKVSDGTLVWTFRGAMSIPDVDWAPDSKSFAYTYTSGETKTLWLVDMEEGTTESIIENVKSMGGFDWAPNGEYIIYTTTEEVKGDDPNFKKYDLPEDRWPGFRNKTALYRVFINSKMTEQLTEPDQAFSYGEISPDSKRILFTKTYYGESKRPYSRSDYYILNLTEMKADSIMTLYHSNGAYWSPDSKQLLVLGGPSTFGKAGNVLPDDVIPNDYDTQAYIYDIESGNVNPISRNFDPQINSAKWDGEHNVIYFSTTDQSYKRLYKYDVAMNSFELIDLGIESLDEIDFSKDFSVALFRGSSSNVIEKVYKYDPNNNNVSPFISPEAKEYSKIKLGKVEDWDFNASDGETIKGRIYYPPSFDENKKYPAIVYYYAGTSPVTREFEGRYPKNYWAANGYVVYVLQPSGATGFGQKFSAKHVNDWGTTTAQEIIEGTQKFLKEHNFVDPEKVGCIGASYGGFETMSLITKTDMFSAAVTHAGISNITSYWGVGYWGYLYNAVAAAESFPWNRKDVYVDKSPIFSADKINTPLLILQGNIDPNVPPGEGMQMYLALKLLGKEVDFIQVDQQEHWIMQYEKRKKWSKTIIAYFDKHLKGQPEWFEVLYK